MARAASVGQVINLEVAYSDPNGNAINADSTPSIQITNPDGDIIKALSSDFVAQTGVGTYRFSYTIPGTGPSGIWTDLWQAYLGNAILEESFSFTAESGGSVVAIFDPDLGDAPVIASCSQAEINNLNCLLDLLKKRLKSTGTRFVRDEFGAIVYDGYGEAVTENCNVFEDSELVTFLRASLSEFNSIPHFTSFTFADFNFCECNSDRFAHIITTGAVLLGLAAQALIEKGREFVITDNGVSFQPPVISDVLNSELSTLLSAYREDLRFQKNQFKPRPAGVGTIYGLTNLVNPRLRALRHLRARQII